MALTSNHAKGDRWQLAEGVRRAFAARYERVLRARLPISKTFHARTITYSEPHQLELHDLTELLRDVVGHREVAFLEDCKALRRQMAHAEPGSAYRIARASAFWEEMCDDFQFDCVAWDWPRCGQRLTLVIGPSGAGKSRWAERNRDPSEVFSSDRIRERLYGRLDMAGDQAPVFTELRRQVVARVASGKSAVIDATNIRRVDRLANVSLMPGDMAVEYVVIDRPMHQKEATVGWRAEKPGLLAEHARLFSDALDDILAGDGLANVNVIDLRHDPEPTRKPPVLD